MKKFISVLCMFSMLISVIPVSASVEKEGIVYYVAPDGSDMSNGTIDHPFATIERARDEVRKANKTQDITVFLRGGEYSISEPISLTSIDGGNENCTITYSAYQDEKPVINGGVVIDEWVEGENGIWYASVPKDFTFRNFYIDGEKSQRARYPDFGTNLYLPKAPDGTGVFIDNDILPKNLSTVNKVEFCANIEWMSKKLRIDSATMEDGLTKLTINPIEWDAMFAPQGAQLSQGREYWLENAMEYLDIPGEWFLDKKESIVYYMPRLYEDMNECTAFAGGIEHLITVEEADYLKFTGIEFKATGWTRPDEAGFVDIQANSLVPVDRTAVTDEQYRYNFKKEQLPGALSIVWSDNITIENCEFNNIAACGISFAVGGENIKIIGNRMYEIGGNGIEIGGDYYRAKDANMFHKNVNISNNYFEKISTDYYGGEAILCYYIDGLTIEHNYIRDASYNGIAVGWGWNAAETVEYARNYVIRYNRIENYMTILRDGAAIYTTNPIGGHNIIEGNYVRGSALRFRTNDFTQAIYHDGATKNWITRNNVLEMVRTPVFLQSMTGQVTYDILVENNYYCPYDITQNDTYLSRNLIVQNNHLQRYPIWNEDAYEIINNAGIEKDYRNETNKMNLYIASCLRQMDLLDNDTVELTISGEGEYRLSVEAPEGIIVNYDERVSVEKEKPTSVILNLKTLSSISDGYYLIAVTLFDEDGRSVKQYVGVDVKDTSAMVVDVTDPGYKEEGTFSISSVKGYGSVTRYGVSAGAWASWTPEIPEDGDYLVYLYKVDYGNSDPEAQIEVVYDGGTYETTLDYTEMTSGMVELGTFPFKKGTSGYVKNTRSNANPDDGFIRTSAVVFVTQTNDEARRKITEQNGIKQFKDAIVMHAGKDYCFVNGEKTRLPNVADIVENDAFVPIDIVANMIGGIYKVNGNECTISKGTRGIRMHIGSDVLEINRKKFKASKAVYLSGEKIMIPISQICEIMGITIVQPSDKLTVISKNLFEDVIYEKAYAAFSE